MGWSIHDIARMTGTTSRTLRHYGDIRLLVPSRISQNGYRFYDTDALMRLQRILLLRDLGLSLKEIAKVLANETDVSSALNAHLNWLRQEQQRLTQQIASVEITLQKTRIGGQLMAEEMFDGFDHTHYRDEVIQRWGRDAYDSGDRWWQSLTEAEKKGFEQQQLDIAADYGRASLAGMPVESDEVQAITQRHYEWLTITSEVGRDHFIGLGEMYVSDPRFTANYDRHGIGTAVFIRDAMKVYADRNL
ncbi:MAG: MerR family transcriptional regulator [Thermomicrobiales bacterium]